MDTPAFQEEVWAKGRELYRPMPWRDDPSFYHVLVSELMLQQTQVDRVRTKFAEFMERFPTIEMLAAATLADVLTAWQGLGYNRRAKFLHEAARQVVREGVPRSREELIKLPGVGKNTAGAIMNYVYQTPTAFVETNIRTVYFHHFYADEQNVSDAEVLKLVEATMDKESPREWFYALMDYGTFLKRAGAGRLTVSRHYKKQAPLKGSVREVRGEIIRRLAGGTMTRDMLQNGYEDDLRFEKALHGLIRDGLITETHGLLQLTK
jgi:A/G-specific adenine glycosylase